MSRWDADPELLRTFLAVRRHRSLTQAGDELFITQSAVSRRIQRLERSLGLALFERLGKTLHLTEAGDALAAEAGALVGTIDRLAELVRMRQSPGKGRLRIGASTTPGLYLLPRCVMRFQAAHPGVEIHFSVENSLRIEERLVLNEIDVGFVGAHLGHAALRLKPILEDEIVCYVASSHALARRRRVVAGDLAAELCFVREPGSATRRSIDTWLRRARVRLERTMEIGCPEAAKVLVRSGMGFSYTSAFALRGPDGVGLSRIPLAGVALLRPIFLALHADKRLSPPMNAFLKLVADDVVSSKRVASYYIGGK